MPLTSPVRLLTPVPAPQSRADVGRWEKRGEQGKRMGAAAGLSDLLSQVVSVVASKGKDRREAGKRGHFIPVAAIAQMLAGRKGRL